MGLPEALVNAQMLLGPSPMLVQRMFVGQAVVLHEISQLQNCGPDVPATP